MKTYIKNISESERELEIEISVEDFNDFFKKAIFKLSRGIKIKGFRHGNAPQEIIEKEIGQTKILETAGEMAIKENYSKVIEKEGIQAIGQPEVTVVKIAKGNPFIFKVKTAVFPEINLPDYSKIAFSVKKKAIQLEEKEIQDALLWLQKSRAKFSQLDRPAQKGDFVEIEFTSSAENEKRKDGFILGEGKLIPGFEDELIGMKSEEDKSISLSFPKNHPQKYLAGKEHSFQIKMLGVKKMELPEMNDQWAQGLGEFKDLLALKQNIEQSIRTEKQKIEQQRVCQEILDKIIQKTEIKIPELLIKAQQNQLLENLKQKISNRLKMSFEEYLKKVKKTEQELLVSLEFEAEKAVKTFLVLKTIAQKEDIKISAKEIEIRVNEYLKTQPSLKNFDIEKLKSYIEEVIRNEKIFKKFEEFSNINN